MVKTFILFVFLFTNLWAVDLETVHQLLLQNKPDQAYQNLNKINNQDHLSTYWHLKAITLWKLFGMDSIGSCLLAAEKAYRLSPTDKLKQQLSWFEAKVTEPIEPIETFYLFKVIHNLIVHFPPIGYSVLTVVSTAVFILVTLPFFTSIIPISSGLSKIFRIISGLLLILSISGSTVRYQWSTQPIGYTLQSGVTLYQKPSRNEREITTLCAGIKLKKLNEFGDWVEVIIPDGRKGWLKNNAVGF